MNRVRSVLTVRPEGPRDCKLSSEGHLCPQSPPGCCVMGSGLSVEEILEFVAQSLLGLPSVQDLPREHSFLLPGLLTLCLNVPHRHLHLSILRLGNRFSATTLC